MSQTSPYIDPDYIPWTPFISVYTIFTPLFLFSSALFWHRREKQPVKARSPPLSLLMSAGSFMMFTMLCIRESNKSLFYCSAYLWISSIFFPFQGILILRAYRLYFLLHWQMSNFSKKNSWFSSNRNKVTTKFLFSLFIGLAIFQILIAVLITIVFPQWQDPGAKGCRMSGEFMFFGICVFLYIIAGLIAIRLLVESNDRFLIAKELKITLFTWGILSIPFFLFNMTSLDELAPYNPYGFSSAYFIIAMLILTQLITIVWPIYESYKDERGWGTLQVEQQRLKDIKFENFEDVLSSMIGLRHFSAHLAGEFSSENILFYLDAKSFQDDLFKPALEEAYKRMNPEEVKKPRSHTLYSKKSNKSKKSVGDGEIDPNASGVFTRLRSATLSTLGIEKNRNRSPSTGSKNSKNSPSASPRGDIIMSSGTTSSTSIPTSGDRSPSITINHSSPGTLLIPPTISSSLLDDDDDDDDDDDLMGTADELVNDPDEGEDPLDSREIPDNWWENQAWCKSYLDYEKIRIQRAVAKRLLEEYLIASISEKEINIDDDIRQSLVTELTEAGIKPDEALMGSGMSFFSGPPQTPRQELTGTESGSWLQWFVACCNPKQVESNLVELNLLEGLGSSNLTDVGDEEASKITKELEEAKQYGPINPEIFARAQDAVFDLMERDSYQRFTKSKHYTRMIEDAEVAKERASSALKGNVV